MNPREIHLNTKLPSPPKTLKRSLLEIHKSKLIVSLKKKKPYILYWY
jgi:hypothetical protein